MDHTQADALNAIVQPAAPRATPRAHPPPAALRAYVAGALPPGARTDVAARAAFAAGTLEDWRQAEVGLHAKTCDRCWQTVVALRAAPAAAPARPRWTVGRPAYRLALGAPYALVLAAGIALGLWGGGVWSPAASDVGGLAPTMSSLPAPASDSDLAALLRESGLDLSPFDLSAPFTEILLDEPATLAELAAARLGDGARWIVIYLFNYAALAELEPLPHAPVPAGTPLRLPVLAAGV